MGNIEWDVEKGLLVVMLLLILGGAGFIVMQESRIDELTRGLPRAEDQLAHIGKRYSETTLLEREVDKDRMAQGTRPIEYLYTQMTASGIGKRSFSIESPKNYSPYVGYNDGDYELRATQGQRTFPREAIAKLMLFIEGETSRMRVTRILLQADRGKRAQPDHWEPRITITDREPTLEE